MWLLEGGLANTNIEDLTIINASRDKSKKNPLKVPVQIGGLTFDKLLIHVRNQSVFTPRSETELLALQTREPKSGGPTGSK